jgi:hypothetical protein
LLYRRQGNINPTTQWAVLCGNIGKQNISFFSKFIIMLVVAHESHQTIVGVISQKSS